MDPRLAAAIARGEIAKKKLAAVEGGSISSTRASQLLGISKQTALRRWRRHQVVGWKRGKAVRFPVWQFAGGKMLEGIEDVLRIIDSDDHWRLMLYFLSNRHSLGDRRPLDLLREGKVAEVIEHAKAYAAENAW